MAIASFEPQEEEDVPLSQEKLPISQTLNHISKKIRIICFLKLLKLKKGKCP